LDPESYRSSIEEDLEKAVVVFNKGDQKIAYTILKEIYNDEPNYPKVKYYLDLAKPKEEKTTLTIQEKRQIVNLYNEALRLFSSNNYQEAFRITEK